MLGSGVTYQRMFADAGVPASGMDDFEFRQFQTATGGTALQTASNAGFAVTGGLITGLVDFGSASCNGQVQFVEVQVRRARPPVVTTSLIAT